jgi:hypothetical protein
MFDSIGTASRKWALPLLWVLLSLFWLMIGVHGVLEHGPFRSGWHLVAIWGLLLVFWLYNLYRAFQREMKG